jgi:hypothetical protein
MPRLRVHESTAGLPDLDDEIGRATAEISRFTAPGVLGFYTHVEAIEIFAVKDDDRRPRNIFSLLVAEQREDADVTAPEYLGSRIRVSGLKSWAFGIKRSIWPLSRLETALEHFRSSQEWNVSDAQLQVGSLAPLPTQFVPADSTVSAPLNGILKNNFWAGSYVVELMDTDKSVLKPLFDKPSLLQSVSAEVQKQLPIKLASLSDRLGNIVIQVPVTVLVASFGSNRLTGDTMVDVRWHPKATPRPLRASCEMQFDGALTAFASEAIPGTESSLRTVDGSGMQRCTLWDQENQVLVAATGATSFISTVGINLQPLDPEPRVFTRAGKEIRVGLVNTIESEVKAPELERGKSWTARRLYTEEAGRLASQRRFVQYKPLPGQESITRAKALDDVRYLLRSYGQKRAYLWDPFLSAEDILDTLFYCPHSGAELRALTAAREPRRGDRTDQTFANRQRAHFTTANSNFRSLRLEYRMKIGTAGWSFHDRFLIFPETREGPLAWSLGSSVNSLGRQHHILQKVDDAQLIADAFEELWKALDRPEQLIWKKP